MPKSKIPVTPLPLAPRLRAALYASAAKKGRKLTIHIQTLLSEAMEAERK